MNYQQFTERFPEASEIGRDMTDETITIYRDNGTDVGAWIENRGDTTGKGEVLSTENADIARSFYAEKTRRSHVERLLQERESLAAKALDTAQRIMERDGIQALRGQAWTDDEYEQIRLAAKVMQHQR